ncbi:hypothetical protein BKA67DRAFT_372625 [Truncatella angustata]|uniref:Uncharacterized protein n=1 Tax=Truncatella angustata TaxID=152316 RepID=A0A9P8ZVB2_9PEZI|nr:uncharacterized protein BKA67DRAFT_372625 [Truncatella angustata]KAH6648788.1 hypothetical protein BKA67DRAFT_372625 [Truncatella angustata]
MPPMIDRPCRATIAAQSELLHCPSQLHASQRHTKLPGQHSFQPQLHDSIANAHQQELVSVKMEPPLHSQHVLSNKRHHSRCSSVLFAHQDIFKNVCQRSAVSQYNLNIVVS